MHDIDLTGDLSVELAVTYLDLEEPQNSHVHTLYAHRGADSTWPWLLRAITNKLSL